MSSYTRDAHPLSHGSIADRMTGSYGPYSIAAPIECVVDKALYPDDAANISKKYMEYNVVIIATKTVVPNCRRVSTMAGFADGDDYVLRETTGTVDNESGTAFDRTKTDSTKWNGDRVLVAFPTGSQSVPVIVGVLPHAATRYGGTRSLGRRRYMTHQGTSAQVDKDGNVQIDVKDKQKVTVNCNNASIVIDADGNITITGDRVSVAGNTVEVGKDPVPTEKAVTVSDLSALLFTINTVAAGIIPPLPDGGKAALTSIVTALQAAGWILAAPDGNFGAPNVTVKR